MLLIIALGALALNAMAFLLYGYDKLMAQAGGWRVSEPLLILWAIAGGIGAWIGCEVFRHKTRKESFRQPMTFAVGMHLCALFALIAFAPRL